MEGQTRVTEDAIMKIKENPTPDSSADVPDLVIQVLDLKSVGNGFIAPWAWQGDDIYHQKDPNLEGEPKCVWTGVTQNEDNSYMVEETTPVKVCGEFLYQFDDCGIMSKTPQECKEYSSQVKRRRVLDFNASEDISSSFKSKERMDLHGHIHPEPWESRLHEDILTPDMEDLGQSEAWLADCLNDTDLNMGSDDGNASITSDVQNGIKEVCNSVLDSGSSTVQRPVRSSRNIIFKGKKSYMRTPSELTAAVAYPFDFIKPSEVRGDVTLKDINQRILTPAPSKAKEVKEDPIIYPTSAFSGKPVVGKTKIPTQGGKGSITIMRTKG